MYRENALWTINDDCYPYIHYLFTFLINNFCKHISNPLVGSREYKNDPFCWRPLDFIEEGHFIQEVSYI